MDRQLAMIMDLQRRLAALTCPSCEQGQLKLMLRCDAHESGCIFVVRCESCRTRFSVDMGTVPPAGHPEEATPNLSQVLCPRCGSTDCSVTFCCDASSQRCAYEIDCAVCRRAGRGHAADRRRSVA